MGRCSLLSPIVIRRKGVFVRRIRTDGPSVPGQDLTGAGLSQDEWESSRAEPLSCHLAAATRRAPQ